jgi:integrase
MPNITFYIDKTNTDREGFAPIKATVSIPYKKDDGKTDYKNITKIVSKVKPQYWNDSEINPKTNRQKRNKQRVSPPKPNEKDNNFEEINDTLDKFQTDAKKYFKECESQSIEITQSIVRDYFKGTKLYLNKTKKELWEAYDEFLKAGEVERAANTIRNRKTIKNYLKTFETETGYKMTFESINLVFFDQLKENVLITKGHGYNYLSAITDKFKAFLNWSLERNYHNNTTFRKFSAPEKEGTIVHLTFPELQHLISFTFESKKLQKARDFYCFGCLTGLRYIDLQRLTKDNVSDGLIKITTQKTNREVFIPVFPGVKTILDRYPDPHKLLPKFSNQKLNKYIKEACKKAEINTMVEYKTFEKNITKTEFKPKHELIGTHTARKTFICLAYDNGLDIEMIKSITGITNERTLRRYLNVSVDSKKEKLTKAFLKLTPQPKPNEETLQTLKDALAKVGFKAENIDDLFSQLDGSVVAEISDTATTKT